ncbi:hypothetical protein TL16_g08742 [Triparma laevis f. inornata]|uniref:Uncharacterized protein n=2 Tax=Triparma laevis TaxID=1534972 RepID=A0A9W7FSB1_9STRA|nr:hypothetical protein TL16_g08742 [Triparma laevis f. inornata]GMI17353.1 hypothetical protein TrLO_g12490 [Triparma laevis f. longispina]
MPTNKKPSGRPAPKSRPTTTSTQSRSVNKSSSRPAPTKPAGSSNKSADTKATRCASVEDFLVNRPTKEEASRRAPSVGGSGVVSPALVEKKRKLERSMSSDNINTHLNTRPEKTSLSGRGIHPAKSTDSDRITHVGYKLGRELIKNNMKEHIRKKDFKSLPSAVAPAIAATSKALDRRLRSDSLKGELLNRQDAARLEPVGVLNAEKVSGRIVANAKKLERKMSADNLKSLLESRPKVEVLQAYNIYPRHSTNIHNQLKTLERKHSAAQLSYKLAERSDRNDLKQRGVIQNDAVAPSLQESQSTISKHLRRKSLETSLLTRPPPSSIRSLTTNYYNDGNSDTRLGESWENDSNSDLYYEKAVEEDYEDDSEEFEVGRWEGQRSSDYDSDSEEGGTSPSLPDLDERMVYAIALRAAAQLEAGDFINHMQKANLKEKILDGDETIVRVVVEFVESNDASKLMLVFQRLSAN